MSVQHLKRDISESRVRHIARNYYTAKQTGMVGVRPRYIELVG